MSIESSTADLRAVTSVWWLFVFLGALSIAVGIVIIFKPGNSLATLAVIAGIFVLIDGLLELIGSLMRSTTNRGLAAVVGVLCVVVGILLIRHPTRAVALIGLLIGIWLVTIGVVRFIVAFEEAGSRTAHFIVAAIEVIAGVVIVANPHIGYTGLALLIGIALIANGIGTSGIGFALRTVHKDPAAYAA